MREIRFRIWDKNNFINKMIYSKVEWFDDMLAFRFDNFDSDVEDLVVMQYTGLKDKNEVEIYEGDIHKDAEHMLWEVIFDKGMYKLENIHIPGRRFICEDVVIIGNIFENPELLKEA